MLKRLLLSAVAIGLASPSFAAVTPNSLVTTQTPKRGLYQFTSASTPASGTTTNAQTVYTAGSNGSKCFAVYMSNTDGSATHVVNYGVYDSTHYVTLGGTTTVSPGTGGVTGVPVVQNLLTSTLSPGTPVDGNGNPFIYLNSGDTLVAWYVTAITSNDFVNVYADCQDF